MDLLRRSVALSLAPLSDGGFVQLAVVASYLLDQIPDAICRGFRVPADTARIDHMRFHKRVFNTDLFGKIPIGQLHILEECLRLFIDVPAHDAHLGCITETLATPLELVLLMGAMNKIVACLAERQQVIRAVAASFT